MLILLITVVILVVVTIAIKLHRAKSFLKNYVKFLQSRGYRVYSYPFMFPKLPIKQAWDAALANHHDAHYDYKNQLCKYDITVSNLFFQPVIEIFSPQIIKQFYQKMNNSQFYIKSQLGISHLQLLLGVQNLLFQEGSAWHRRRQALDAAFNINFIIEKIPKIQQLTRQVFNEWQLKKNPNSPYLRCIIDGPLYKIFSTVLLKCFDKNQDIQKIGNQQTIYYVREIISGINMAAASPPGKLGAMMGTKVMKKIIAETNKPLMERIKNFRETMRNAIIKRIRQIKTNSQNNKPQDLIQGLLLRDQFDLGDVQAFGKQIKKNVKKPITVENIINQLIILFIAGSDTVSTMTKMMICLLSEYPQVMQKVRQEIQRQIKTDQICYHQLNKLKYLQYVQNQALRMYSAIGTLITRAAQQDHKLGDIKIYKGMCVSGRFRGTHFRQTDYPSAKNFKPERWNDVRLTNEYSFIPFGVGQRQCFGRFLAAIQNKVVMVQILRRYKDVKSLKKISEMMMKMQAAYEVERVEVELTKR